MNNLFKRSLMLVLTLCLMLVCFGSLRVNADVTWIRVTKVSDITSGGTFIIGYEATANSGIIVPMNNTGTATTSAAGLLYSGNGGNSDTIDMNEPPATANYEVVIVPSTAVNGAVCIKIGNNFVGNTNTKNNLKLFTEQSTTTAFTPTIGNNDVVTLTIAANATYTTLQYNQTNPRFAVYGGTQKNLVLYKKNAPELIDLSAPTNLAINGNNISFVKVDNASKYEILLFQDGTNDITISNLLPSAFVVNGSTYSYKLPLLSGEIDYTVKVKAIGDGETYDDSDFSSGVALSKTTFTSGYNKDSMGHSTYDQFADFDTEFTVEDSKMVLAPGASVLFENAVKSVDKVVVRSQGQCDLTLTTNTSVEPISEKKSSIYIYTYNMNDVNEFMIENNGENDAKLYQLIIYYTYPEGLHNISYVLNGGTNAVGNPTTYETGEGTTAISPATKYGFEFNGWYTNSGFNGDAVTEISNLNTENITLYAKFTELAWHKFLSLNTVGSLRIDFTRINIQNVQGYFLVEDVSDLSVGDQIIIAASGSNNAMGTENANNIGRVEISKVGKQLTYTTTPLILTLVAGSKNNTFALYDGEHYLYAGSSSSNYLKSDKTEVDDNASFAITITNGEAAIVAQGNYTRNIIRFNSSNNPNIFSCYGSGQQPVAIYKYVNGQTCDYQFNQVDMRFGVDKVTTVLYNELGNSVEYGIAAVQASSYDVEQGSTTAPTNYIICTNVADVEGGKTFALLMQNIPQQARSTVITARAFVKIDGKYYYANAATYSVKTLAAEYVSPSADKSGYLNEVGMLQALSE